MPVFAVAVAAAAALGAQQGWLGGDDGTTANIPPPTATAAPTTAASRSSQPSTRPAQSPTAKSSPSAAPVNDEARRVLSGCRAEVRAGDAVLRAAKVGVGHWSEHVQAQTDASSGEISTKKMNAIFDRTRLAGPGDVERYERARKKLQESDGSCRAPEGAPAALEDRLAVCRERGNEQDPVLAAAEDAMQDWESHLGDMRRSRMGHAHDPRGVWMRAWRAAPRNISAYEKATKDFQAPKC